MVVTSASRVDLVCVGDSLARIQLCFAGFLLLGFGLSALEAPPAVPMASPNRLVVPVGLATFLVYIYYMILVYRCSAAMGRSGVNWLLICFLFPWIGPLILSSISRRWLIEQGLTVNLLGFGYELPADTGGKPGEPEPGGTLAATSVGASVRSAPVKNNQFTLRLCRVFVTAGLTTTASLVAAAGVWTAPGTGSVGSYLGTVLVCALTAVASGAACDFALLRLLQFAESRAISPLELQQSTEPLRSGGAKKFGAAVAVLSVVVGVFRPPLANSLLTLVIVTGLVAILAIGSGKVAD